VPDDWIVAGSLFHVLSVKIGVGVLAVRRRKNQARCSAIAERPRYSFSQK